MPTNKYTPQIEELEKANQFDADPRPVNPKYVGEMKPNKFKYLPKNIFYKIYTLIIRGILFVLGPFVTWLYFDLRVRGRKNLKPVKGQGAIVVSNHVHLLDALYLRQVSYFHQMYYLAAQHNNKKGLAGLTLRVAGVLPLSSDFEIAKQLDGVITKVLQKKKLLTIYAEQALWIGYTKIRPFKNGAFHFAVKNNAPVVPVITLFRKPTWLDKIIFRKYKVTLKILPPVFPDTSLGYKQRLLKMRDQCHDEMVKCANEFYGYECDATKLTLPDTEDVMVEPEHPYSIDESSIDKKD